MWLGDCRHLIDAKHVALKVNALHASTVLYVLWKLSPSGRY